MNKDIETLMKELNSDFKEREDEIAGSLLALLSGEHVLLLGPPGTAKSLMARTVCGCVEDGGFFYYLLTRFTTPEEIFGPLSLADLQADKYHRKTEGYLPVANVAFLDEIFKANSSILNSLLTILNERKYHNGSNVVEVPLLTVYGASNELPEEDENLEALYDRFIFRFYVDYVQDESNFKELVSKLGDDFTPSIKLSIDDLRRICDGSKDMAVDPDVLETMVTIRKDFRSKNYNVSDRRWKKILKILKIAAHGLERSSVDRSMIPLLQHMLWDDPDQRDPMRDMLLNLTVTGGIHLDKLKMDLDDLYSTAKEWKDCDLPGTAFCDECKTEFKKWNELNAHTDANVGHQIFFGEYRYSFYSLKMEFGRLGGIRTSIEAGNKELLNKEIAEIGHELTRAQQIMNDERDRLKDLLSTNLWISEKDRRDILIRYDRKIRFLSDIQVQMAKLKIFVNEDDDLELPEDDKEP